MKRTILSILSVLSFHILLAQSPVQAVKTYVSQAAAKEPLKSSSWGMKAVDGKGNTIVEWSSSRRFVPASNMKLVTTGTALWHLGASHRFITEIAYSGEIDSTGVLHGDVYILGGGDPTIGTTDSIAVATNTLFRNWCASLMKQGIRSVDGFVIGDGRYFDGPLENMTWAYDDLGLYYGTGGNGLSFYANTLDITVAAGPEPGDSVRIVSTWPEAPWMTYRFNCTTGKKGSGDNLFYFTTDLAPVGELRGTFAVDRKSKVEGCSNKFGDLTCAYYFCRYLSDAGIEVLRGPARIGIDGVLTDALFDRYPSVAVPRDSVTVVGSTLSPTLAKIAFETNHRSDNFYAESLLRQLGVDITGSAEYDSCYVAERQVLSNMGMGKNGIRIEDGSGLSRRNYVTPAWMVAFLRTMMKSRSFDAYLHSLPSPGKEGTLKSLMSREPSSLKSRIYMKSGSMNGVLCYSGYILSPDKDPSKTITFSILTTNSVAPTSEVRDVLMAIISRLAAVNA